MKTIDINSTDLALIFWKKILDNCLSKQKIYQKDFLKQIDTLDALRYQSDYNTGSISTTTAWLLFSITLFFKPKSIFEIGSFIGKSTFSMAFAADMYSHEHKCEIFCCDMSNKIPFPKLSKTKITQFHKTSSSEMLKSIDIKKNCDLIHLDGSLQNEDFELLKQRLNDQTIFVLDDFEGCEKGVINLITALDKSLISRKSHFLIFPIENEIKKQYGLLEKSSSAVLLPIKYLRITSQ